VIGRIPILDVQPVLECGRRPAKAVAGETFEVSATIFREGHEMLGAGVVLRTPSGERQPLVGMAEAMPGTDRHAARVTVGGEGRWQFQVEAWGDSIAHWRHDAGIKVPRGLDVGLMMAEGAILFERAARSIRPNRAVPAGSAGPVGPAGPGGPAAPPAPPGARWAHAARAAQSAQAARSALLALAARLRDPAIPPWDRLAAADDDEILAILAAHPLRELLTRSPSYPLAVHR
jgi:starch synthase (maltosyl-transferring)